MLDTVMLFAAGFGTRMGVLTRDRPKPLIEVAGQPLIDHALELVEAAGVPNRVANLHYKAEMLAAHLQPRGVNLSLESPQILDTGGGLKAALPLTGPGPLFTMNTDVIWSGPNPLDLLRATWQPDSMDALLMCVPLENTIGRKAPGDFALDRAGKITRGGDLVYGGLQILKTQDVARHDETVFSLNAIWDVLAARGRLFGAVYPGRWCDIGHPEGIRLAEALLSEPHV
ncbi:nucleotidyltransferase [Pseudooceanicola lipolyticus]|uniref:Nucleotidyltransferase n=1 Tax=Pseudooceanicola lipolyticus TaxID=2029104 RepID=A0A2M8J3M3_9RHOB|nr:nucleotidyltransferase family protein [Pseudooceanicola lipolyticus]PJE37381.1 nucleotidyltransferase [Pseudooceanicola lipolyticus]